MSELETRELEFTFRLDGEQTATLLAALRTHQRMSDRHDIEELNAVLTEQFKAQT